MDTIFSKKEICFLNPDTLILTIQRLEQNLPGWWWSISQRPTSLTISVGPTKHSPLVTDVALANTKFGDAGFINEYYHKNECSERFFLSWLSKLFDIFELHRSVMTICEDLTVLSGGPQRRFQSHDDLTDLKARYAEFLVEVSAIEQKGWVLSEVYLGSCELSVDCSLRGHKDHVAEDAENYLFDHTCDIQEKDCNISQSLSEALEYLKEDIETVSQSDLTKGV
jgi:hypothetical protein